MNNKLLWTAKAYKKVVHFLADIKTDTLQQKIALDFIRAEWGAKYSYAMYAYYDYCSKNPEFCTEEVDEWFDTPEDVKKSYEDSASDWMHSYKSNQSILDTLRGYMEFCEVGKQYKKFFDMVSYNF